MAQIPLPLGIGVALVDIARGIGAAARALPERSRSYVGAVAMKSARVRIDFEMATVTTERDSGLGIRTHQLFGIGTVDNDTVTSSASKGFIEFEVVAISPVDPAEQPAVGRPLPTMAVSPFGGPAPSPPVAAGTGPPGLPPVDLREANRGNIREANEGVAMPLVQPATGTGPPASSPVDLREADRRDIREANESVAMPLVQPATGTGQPVSSLFDLSEIDRREIREANRQAAIKAVGQAVKANRAGKPARAIKLLQNVQQLLAAASASPPGREG